MSDYPGMYRGAVHDVNDPERRGRLRILVPSVLGSSPSGWAEPALPADDAPPWAVGDRVWVLFEGGDLNRPVYISRMVVGADDIPDGVISQAKLDAALQSLVDTGVDVFFGDAAPPVSPDEDDIWFHDNGTTERFDGSVWVPFHDPGIAQALAAAGDAADLADGKMAIYYDPAPPTVNNLGIALGPSDTGDIWVETDNGNKLYKWTGSAWTALPLGSGALDTALNTAIATAITDSADAKSIADGKINAYFQTSIPWANGLTTHDTDIGDLWFDTDDQNKMYRWGGATNRNWILSDDQRISAAITAAAAAQQAADTSMLQGSTTLNPFFDTWPSGNALPTSWPALTGQTPTRETVNVRTAPTAVRWPLTAGTAAYILQTHDTMPNTRWIAVSIDFQLVSGTLGGSGALLRWLNTVGGTGDVFIDLAAEVPTPELGKWYRVTKIIERPSWFVGTYASTYLYLMGGYSGIGTITAKDIIFDAATIRPATAAEISTVNTAATVTTLSGVVATKITTFYQTGIPTSTAIGDLWVKTDDNNRLYRAEAIGATTIAAGQWVAFQFGLTALTTTIQNTLAASITSYSGTTQPVSPKNGDMWVRPEQVADAQGNLITVNVLYQFNSSRTAGTEPGSQWVKTDDPAVQQAMINAQAAANLADSKVRIFADNKHPTKFTPASDPVMTDADVGDLWIRLDEGNKTYRYDGAEQGWVSAQATNADVFTVFTKLALTGPGNEIAKDAVFTAQSGVTAPSAPSIVSSYTVNNIHQGYNPRGLAYHAASDRYFSTESVYSGVLTATYVDATTKDHIWAYAYNLSTARSEVQSAMGGVAIIGNVAYMLCQTTEVVPGTFNARWYVYKVTWSSGTTWNYTSRWLYEPSGQLGGNSTWLPMIGAHGSNVAIAQTNAAGNVKVTEYDSSGNMVGTVQNFTNTDTTGYAQAKHCSGIVVSQADLGLGVEKYWLTFEGRNTAYAFNAAQVREPANDFTLPNSTTTGFMWDSSLTSPRFRSRTTTNIYKFSAIKDTNFASSALNVAISWRNATTGSETALSPAYVSTSFPKRSNLMILSDTIPNDTANANDPDAVGFYVARGTSPTRTSYRRATVSHTVAGQQILVLEDLPPNTNAVPPDPTTTPFPASTPGKFMSAANTGGDPQWYLAGDGTAKIGSVVKVDAAGNDLNDTGWVSGWATKGGSTPFPANASTTINYAEYRKIGKAVHVRVSIVAGAAFNPATADFANQIVVSGLPALAVPSVTTVALGRYSDTPATVVVANSGTITLVGGHSPSPNWVAGDTLIIDAHYFVG